MGGTQSLCSSTRLGAETHQGPACRCGQLYGYQSKRGWPETSSLRAVVLFLTLRVFAEGIPSVHLFHRGASGSASGFSVAEPSGGNTLGLWEIPSVRQG